jgi:hypothetical protein
VLPRWTDNGTIIWPGSFPRNEREPTFVETDEETLRRRSLRDRIVTPEPGTVERTALWRAVGVWRERLIRRERRLAIARSVGAIFLGAACGVGAALAAAGSAEATYTVRASVATKSVVTSSESKLPRRTSAEHRAHEAVRDVGNVAPPRSTRRPVEHARARPAYYTPARI